MTKLKNTKKGMAKKALSISLVAAMLATSNVPVWAAEDLFSDGGATVETPVVDAFSDNTDSNATTITEETPAIDDSVSLASTDDMTNKTDFSGIKIVRNAMDGSIQITGQIKKENGDALQSFKYQLIQNGTILDEGSLNDSNGVTLDIQNNIAKSGNVTLKLYRNDNVYNFDYSTTFFVGVIGDTTYTWKANGAVIGNGIAYDAGTISVEAVLPRTLTYGESATIHFEDANGSALTGRTSSTSLEGSGNTLIASYTLSKEDIGKNIKAVITLQKSGENNLVDESNPVEITDAYVTLEGQPVIKVKSGEAEVRPDVTLTVDTAKVTAPSDPNFTDFTYQWQWYDTDAKEWKNIGNPSKNPDYVVKTNDYGRKLRVAVFGGDYYTADKSVFSDEVSVVADDLNTQLVGITTVGLNDKNNNGIKEKEFNPLDSEANKLVDKNGNSQINVTYKNIALVAGTDYTLKYEGIDQIGTVTVTITILPTERTAYSSGSVVKKDLYELTAPAPNASFVVTSADTSSEYNGKAVIPKVTVKTDNGNTIVDESEYKVYSVGPDAGTYDVNVYVNGQGMATTNGQTHTITQKDINDHESDFNLVIPDAIWDASENAVENNTVANAKIQLFDNSVSATEDLMETQNYTIEALNWGEGGVKKAIRINFDGQPDNNYQGVLTVDGEVNSRSIAQFQAQFTTTIKAEAGSRVYNGRLQDVLGQILDANHGYIEFTDGTKLYEGRDFEYKIVKGGTDVGDVSIYIEGKGNYDGNMTLSNVYSISKANFRYGVDGSDDFTITYDPSLGDAGADISAYVDLAKSMYSAKMIDGGYKLTLGKDFWLDQVSSASNWNLLWFKPTVAENKVEGHGENANFVTTGYEADKDLVKVELVRKNLNDSDIKITVESAEYNGGKLVTPTVKVTYEKDGKEYVINPEYYDVQIIQSAYDQGETGKVNIVAKNILDTQKYPQLYTGNKMVDYTVGKTNLALGKIVATNGLETLPSVAYDATQAATETGITLDASKYVVKDSSGNIVDPKSYTVSYTNNKAVGTATITVTGKAPYEGSISSTFTITKNNLPSGTVTLMSDKLSKVYTGEDIELVKGTDYNITGELAGLKEGTDYMIVYENNVNVTDDKEKAEFKVVGINNYAGEVVKYFDITPATITASNIKLGNAVYQGGVAVRPEVTITIPGGNATLTEGTDYTVSYLKAATNAGDEGLVQISYADSKNINTKDSAKEATYTVSAKDLKDVTILEIADQEATGEQLKPEVTVMNGAVKLVEGKDYKVIYGENKEIGLGTVTIQPADGNNNYTGSQEAEFKIIEATPEVGQATIAEVKISGNTVTPVLSEEVNGAVGYDYVLATEEDYTNGRVQISKNILTTNTNFYYVEEGTYYVYCHAWKRDENGVKVFGEWSNLMKVDVTATTPEKPVITKLQKSSNGKHLKITWTKSADADGYDVVMGQAVRKVNGEYRPVDYGKAVKKVTNGNTVSVIFYNIPKGTYYVGLHAYNRTSETGTKVFSKWSNTKAVTFK